MITSRSIHDPANGVTLLLLLFCFVLFLNFPGGSDNKVSAYNTGDPDSIPGSGRPSGEGNGNPLQYSCLENAMDGEVL